MDNNQAVEWRVDRSMLLIVHILYVLFVCHVPSHLPSSVMIYHDMCSRMPKKPKKPSIIRPSKKSTPSPSAAAVTKATPSAATGGAAAVASSGTAGGGMMDRSAARVIPIDESITAISRVLHDLDDIKIMPSTLIGMIITYIGYPRLFLIGKPYCCTAVSIMLLHHMMHILMCMVAYVSYISYVSYVCLGGFQESTGYGGSRTCHIAPFAGERRWVRGPSLFDARKSTPVAMYRNGEVMLTSGCERIDTSTTIDHCYITDLLTEESVDPARETLFAVHKTYGWHRTQLQVDYKSSVDNRAGRDLQLNRRDTCGVVTPSGTLHVIGGTVNDNTAHSTYLVALSDHIVYGSQRAISSHHILYRNAPPGAARRGACACATDTHIYLTGTHAFTHYCI